MTNATPNIISDFEYDGVTYGVEWFDLPADKPLPELPWQQVYALGNYKGSVPVVHYSALGDNLPGGRLEPGEDAETALCREVVEELNMRVVYWRPIGYQLVTPPNGHKVYQLRVYAELEKIGEFMNDPGGTITGHTLVPIDELNDCINYGKVGERMIEIYKSLRR